jgi:hypothetical protein
MKKSRFDPNKKITVADFRKLVTEIPDDAEIYYSEVAIPDAVAGGGTIEDVRFLQFSVFKFHPRFKLGPSEFSSESESVEQE